MYISIIYVLRGCIYAHALYYLHMANMKVNSPLFDLSEVIFYTRMSIKVYCKLHLRARM